jgi:hypothetical protein
MVAFEVVDSILTFAIVGLMEFFHDRRARRLRSMVVSVNIVDKHRQGLGFETGLRWTCAAQARAPELHVAIFKSPLRKDDAEDL